MADGSTPDVGHNSKTELTDEQKQALFFHHRRLYDGRLSAKKAADAEFKNACKLIKSEGGSVADIKLSISLEADGGEEAMQQSIQDQLRVARWMGAALGTQFSMFDATDRAPATEKAFNEGKRAGMAGETAKTPAGYTGEAEQQWLAGHAKGQEVLMSTLPLTKDGVSVIKGKPGRKKKAAAPPKEDDDAFGEAE